MKRFKTMFLAMVLLSVFLFFGRQAYAIGEPGLCPDGSQQVPVGPSIVGELVLGDSIIDPITFNYAVMAVFQGKCHRLHVAIGRLLPGDLSTINTADDLIDVILPQSGFPGCNSEAGGEDLIITRVKHFSIPEDPLAGFKYVTADITAASLGCRDSKKKGK